MNTKIKSIGLGVAVAAIAFAPLLTFAQVSTTTIGTRIDAETATLFDYIDLAIAKFWPVLLGLALIIAVFLVGKRVYSYMHSG